MGHPTGSESDDEEKISCWKKVKRRVPVFSAIFLMLFCSSLYFVFIATHFFIQTEIYWKVLVIVQGFIAVFMFVNFLCATFSDPGFFQKSNGPEDNQSDGPLTRNIEIRSFNVKVKWCSTCSFYRPPRCSHCSVCDYCVEKFDHHCPWVNNCIGLRNYRYFFGFITGLTVHMLSLVTFITLYLVQTWHRKDFAFIVCWVILGVLVVAFPLVVSLTCFHIYLVITGRTTNEQVTGKFAAGHNPFDMGCWSNCCSVLCGPQYPSYAEFTYVNRSSLQEARIAWQKAPLESKQHYGAEVTSPANVEIQILPDHHNKHLSVLNSKHHHPIMMHSQLAKNGVSNVNRTPGSNHVMFGERNAAGAGGVVTSANNVINLNTVDGTMGGGGGGTTGGNNIPQQHNFSSISTTTNSTAFPSPSNRKTYSALHQQQQQQPPPMHSSSINGGSGINAQQYSVQNHHHHQQQQQQQQQQMANLNSGGGGGNMAAPGMMPGGAGTVSNMHQRHQQKQPTSPNFRTQRGQNVVGNNKAMTPRMASGQQRLNSADILAPDLSDLEFEMSNAAGVGGGVPKQISITAPGNAWSGDHASLEAHLMSPVNQAGASSCTKSISLINAMQTCDMAIGNQKTSSYRPINNASSNNSSKMLVAPGSQLPTRNPPKPPSRKSSTDQPKSVDLNNEEIFEISV